MDSESKPVLVVGGTGFLGRKVVAALVARGKRVRALVRPGSNASVLGNPEVEVVRATCWIVRRWMRPCKAQMPS